MTIDEMMMMMMMTRVNLSVERRHDVTSDI